MSLNVLYQSVQVAPIAVHRDWSSTGSTNATWIGHAVGRKFRTASGPSGLIQPAGLKMLVIVDQPGMNSRPRLMNAVNAQMERHGPGSTHMRGSWTSGGKIGFAATRS